MDELQELMEMVITGDYDNVEKKVHIFLKGIVYTFTASVGEYSPFTADGYLITLIRVKE